MGSIKRTGTEPALWKGIHGKMNRDVDDLSRSWVGGFFIARPPEAVSICAFVFFYFNVIQPQDIPKRQIHIVGFEILF